MSEETGHVELTADESAGDNGTREMGSLASRMETRAREIESVYSWVFPIPAWEDMLGVELRLVGWEKLRRIVTKHERQRVPALQELYTAADQLIEATEGFYELEEDRKTPVQETWVTLARATGRNLPDNLTLRQALISLMGDTNVLILWKEWQDWMSSRRSDAEEEVSKDFGTTP